MNKNKIFSLGLAFTLLFSSTALAELHNGMDADVVIGQADFTSNTSGVTQTNFAYFYYGHTDGKKLFLEDYNGSRVLIWNSIPKSNGAPADVVLGQPDFTSDTRNNGGISASSLNLPWGTWTDGRRLFVSDYNNNRVLIWSTIPASNNTPADVVLGQPDFVSNNCAASQRDFCGPGPSATDGKRLFVMDYQNHRVLIWNSIPTTNYAPADVVIGQSNFSVSGSGIGPDRLSYPYAVFFDGRKIFVADLNNNRVLIWNSVPTQNGTPADVVVGQKDFYSKVSGGGRKGLNSLQGVYSDGQSLYVADSGNNRVLIWKEIPTTNGAPADFVLGQPDFNSTECRTSRDGMCYPAGIFRNGRKLFVGDGSNYRWLIFNLGDSSSKNLGPQFTQGKAVVGKVFEDLNGNGIQDSLQLAASSLQQERGLEGIKVVSDTGIYAITDEDGKYHFPYIETGQHLLKIDESTLPTGSTLTTDSPYKVTVTEGILTKVSFGVKLPVIASEAKQSKLDQIASSATPPRNDIKVSISQDPVLLKPSLGITAKEDGEFIVFTIRCNYFLFIDHSEILLFDKDNHPFKTITLPSPIPMEYKLPLKDLLPQDTHTFYYQLKVYDKQGKEDRAGVGMVELK